MDIHTIKIACAKSFAFFCHFMQGDNWFDPKHEELCNFIQKECEAVLQGDPENSEETVQLLIVLARGSLKSTIVSKYFSIWCCLPDISMPWKSPDFRTLLAMNTHPNARAKIRGIRDVFDKEEAFRALWPELLPLEKDKWSDESACINRPSSFEQSTFEGCGTKTRVTSRHYNMVVEDDTTAPEEKGQNDSDVLTPSIEEIERAIGWHKRATPLLVPKGPRIRIVVTTRWGDYDLVSHIKDKEQYKCFDMPAWNPPEGWSSKESERVGNPSMSIFYSANQLENIESNVGPYMFQCLYLNNPLDPSKRTFQNQWFHWVEPKDVPVDTGYFALSVDPAISEKNSSCETAITRIKHVILRGYKPIQYWMDAIHGHFSPTETVNKILDLVEEDPHNTKYIIIETVAYQAALKYALLDGMVERNLHIKIIPFQGSRVMGTKDARIEGMQPYFAAGRIFLVKGLSPQVESQLRQFPHGRLRDVIDAFSMQYKLYKKIKAEPEAEKVKVQVQGPTMEQVKRDIKRRRNTIYSISRKPVAYFNYSNSSYAGVN